MAKRILYCLFLILSTTPAWAHEGHEIVEHHWQNARYISEVKIQALFMLLVIIVYALAKNIRKIITSERTV